ncbi:MAG: cora-like Mg2+ transporter protein-domain-containing protein [Monoraphidium minutum]|nr:MAG: cora-like Mg2+ transporter protein-domain-containing protein [Monoraphidium minutum]
MEDRPPESIRVLPPPAAMDGALREPEARVRFGGDAAPAGAAPPLTASAPPLAPPSSRSAPSRAATGADADWFTYDMHVPSSVRLNRLMGAAARGGPAAGAASSRGGGGGGAGAGGGGTGSSGWSELDLEALSELHCHCDITVVDYCRTRTRFTTGERRAALTAAFRRPMRSPLPCLTNASLGPFLAKERPTWSKVRWVCVDGGISGDVLQCLTAAYDLQPLALEDVTTFQRIKVDSYREHLYIASYVWDLVDRPRSKDRERARQRQHQRRQAAPASGKGAGADVEAGPPAAARRGGGGALGAAREWLGLGGPRLRRSSARRWNAQSVGWDGAAREERRRLRASGGGGATNSSGSSSGVSSSGADVSSGGSGSSSDDSDGGGGGGGAARRRGWADDDSAQAALEGWQGKLHAERLALVRQWAATEGDGGGGSGGAGGAAAARQFSETPAGRVESLAAEAAAGPPAARVASAPALGAGAPPAPGAPPAGRAASAVGGGAPELLGRTAACCHLGAKHRRRARLRVPLQAPFIAYQSSGRSLGRKRVMLEQVSFFLCPGGILVSLFQRTGRAVAAPVLARLRGMQSLLIDSEDAGVLLQALLQSAMDYSVPVFEAFAAKVAGVDAQVLRGTFEVKQSRRLHLISTDLGIMLRSFSSVQPMLAALQARCVLPPEDSDDSGDEPDYYGDLEAAGGGEGGRDGSPSVRSGRSGAAAAAAAAPEGRSSGARRGAVPGGRAAPRPRSAAAASSAGGGGARGGVRGGLRQGGHGGLLLTELAGMYIGDVHDQAVTGEQDLATLLEHANRLSDLVFNNVSHSNEAANMILAMLGALFMPLTFVAGVYGTNFENLPEVKWPRGYLYFWVVCAALLAVSVGLLLWAGIMKLPPWAARGPRALARRLAGGGAARGRRR